MAYPCKLFTDYAAGKWWADKSLQQIIRVTATVILQGHDTFSRQTKKISSTIIGIDSI